MIPSKKFKDLFYTLYNGQKTNERDIKEFSNGEDRSNGIILLLKKSS